MLLYSKFFFAHKKNYIENNIYEEYKNPNLIYVTSHFDVIKKLVNKNHKVLVVNNYTRIIIILFQVVMIMKVKIF